MILPIREARGTGAEWRLHTASRWPVHAGWLLVRHTQIARPAFHRVTDLFYEMARRPGHRDAPPCPRLYWVLTRRVPRTSPYTLSDTYRCFIGIHYLSTAAISPHREEGRLLRISIQVSSLGTSLGDKLAGKERKKERKEDRKASRSRSPLGRSNVQIRPRRFRPGFLASSMILVSRARSNSLRTISVSVAASLRTIGRWLSVFEAGARRFSRDFRNERLKCSEILQLYLLVCADNSVFENLSRLMGSAREMRFSLIFYDILFL